MIKLLIRILIIVIILVYAKSINAQDALSKGSHSFEGTISYSTSSISQGSVSSNSHTFTFAPQLVYFVGDRISLGILLNYTNQYEYFTRSSFSMGPSFRYYFNVEEIIPFVQASFNIADPNLESSSGLSLGFGLTAGINYFLSGSVALEPSISYNYSNYSPSGSGSGSSYSTNGFKVGIGVSYYIFKEK